METPKVTIAIPTLNRVTFLRLALESALAQTYSNIEIIVSNNASSDGTADYLAKCVDPRIRVLNQSTLLPMVDNWNACVSAARGQYFLLLSDDDVLEPNAIHELVTAYFESEKDNLSIGIVYCGGSIIDAEGKTVRFFKHSPRIEKASDLIPAFFSEERDLWLCAILFRIRDVVPGFPVEYFWAPDSIVWIRSVIQKGDAVYVAKELVRYRVHQNATASLPLHTWKREIIQLGKFAIELSKESHELSPHFVRNLNIAIKRLLIRSIPYRINQSLGSRKKQALYCYIRESPIFFSLYGIKFLLLGILSLFLKESTKRKLRNIFMRR